MAIRVLLADDHAMMREGLRLILGRAADVEVVGEAASGREALRLVKKLVSDVVVMDIGMADLNGVEATRRITADFPAVKVVGLSTYADRRYVLAMLEAGASGYVVKRAVGDELLGAVQAAAEGRQYLSSEITGLVVGAYVQRLLPSETSAYAVLGSREREVLQLLAEGKSSREIAAALHVAVTTAETHRRNIMRKLDLHSVAELTKYAVREGLTRLEE